MDGLDEQMEAVDREVSTFQQGPGPRLFGGVLPVRALIAIALFVVVFVAVWMAFWALAGGLGLALGWIPAALVGALAVVIAGRSFSSASNSRV
jgi:hypothetical protein